MKTVIALIVVSLTLVAAIGLTVAGCVTGVEAKTGTIEVRVTDAPPGYEIISIVVTIAEEGVEVHRAGDNGDDGGWIPLAITGDNPFDLLLIQGIEEVLAIEEVDVGKYTQIRMNIVEVEVTYLEDGVETIVEATLPSGQLKFVRPFEVVGDSLTVIVLDFDAAKSVVVTGGGKVIFKPVVKLAIQQGDKPQELTVEGTISAVNTGASTISIIPNVGDEIVLNVNPQTEITLDGNPAILGDLDELGEGHSVTAYYYLENLKATQVIALSPPPPQS